MTRPQLLLFAVVIASLFALPLLGNNYVLRLATIVLMYAVLAMAWNVVGGFAGYPLFGIAAFFGLGAYAGAVVQSSGYPVGAGLDRSRSSIGSLSPSLLGFDPAAAARPCLCHRDASSSPKCCAS